VSRPGEACGGLGGNEAETARGEGMSEAYWKPKHNPFAIALTVTLATFMEVLDTSIANVALPHIAGNLSASQDESTWVLTSYLVSNAIILPMSAWLASTFGRKRFYMTCVFLFTCSSFLCGLAPSLGMLVFFRVLQGAGGGGLQPSEQAILADTFPPNRRGMAFAIYGMAVVIAPAIGPTIGGWITDNYSWHWIFYINVPVGILSLFLTNRLVEDPPYLAEQRKQRKEAGIDYIGISLIVLAVGCLQIVLDKGQELDWFDSRLITGLLAVVIVAFVIWVYWEWHHAFPIVDVKLFKRRNFATAMFFTFSLGIVLFGTTVMLPQFLQTLMGYSAEQAGEALAGGGLIMLVAMPIAGFLVSRVDPRAMMACGFAMTAWAVYNLATNINLSLDFKTAFLMRVYQTAGLAFIFLPSNTLAYVGVPREKNNQISSMNSFVRNLGGSVGIATITTILTRQAQKHTSYLSTQTFAGNPPFENLRRGLTNLNSGSGPGLATKQAYAQISGLIQRQAVTLAYTDVLYGLTIVVVILVPLVMIMKRPPKPTPLVAKTQAAETKEEAPILH
jgi:DHA2 family multidrug resistance protein